MARDERHADMMSAIEALLFVSDEPASANRLAEILEVDPSEVEEALALLSEEYSSENRGMQLREVAGGWRFYTHPAHYEIIERYVVSWDTHRMSQAALETLAIIAYHQPVTRAGVNAIRGVNSEGVVSSLVEKGLVREAGREKPGGAVLYRTTRAFLERFGLKSIDELPPLEDFAPDEESREYIRERLSGSDKGQETQIEIEGGPDLRMDVQVMLSDGGFTVEDVDNGDDERNDDAEEMGQIIGQAMTEKVGEFLADEDEDEGDDDDDDDDDDDASFRGPSSANPDDDDDDDIEIIE